jgi:hypothetical protein
VKRLAQDRGWQVTVEKSVLDGTGAVDVALEKDEQRMACEISVTTSVEHELGNAQKCLAAGYDRVLLIVSEKKNVSQIERALAKDLSPESRARVQVLQPEDLVGYLDALVTLEPAEQTVRGYRVKVSYKRVGKAEENAKRQAISQVLLRGRRGMK